jgi:hypothetical protein
VVAEPVAGERAVVEPVVGVLAGERAVVEPELGAVRGGWEEEEEAGREEVGWKLNETDLERGGSPLRARDI